jgi:hypothetical protein
LTCVVTGAEAEGGVVAVRFAPVGGRPPEIVDRIQLGPEDSPSVVRDVGRLLRILRAGRMTLPDSPYRLEEDPEGVAALLERCRGARVIVHVTVRMERVLTVWTESGVDRFRGVVDFSEDADGLSIRRRGGGSVLRVPRHSLIRFSTQAHEYSEVLEIEAPARSSLN